MTLTEPLISTSRRIRADEEMIAFMASNGQWSCHWFAGFIFDVASTLPPNDPWRHLSATLHLTDISLGESVGKSDTDLVYNNPRGAKAPVQTGAVLPDGTVFGTVHDSDDIVIQGQGTPDSDIGVVGLDEALTDLSSALAGFATSNVEALADVIAKVRHHMWIASDLGGRVEEPTPQLLLDALAPVLRRFIHRRRLYTGPGDPYPAMVGFAWMARADRLMDGNRNISSELGLNQHAQIDPEAYDDIKVI